VNFWIAEAEFTGRMLYLSAAKMTASLWHHILLQPEINTQEYIHIQAIF